MRKLKRPTESVAGVFMDCVSTIANAGDKQRHIDNLAEFVQAENRYIYLAEHEILHTAPNRGSATCNLSDKEMIKLYTYRMLNESHQARNYYNKWLVSTENEVCPLCGVRPVKTLDHYLPKADYPIFSITPINLIPSCRDCNFDKLTQTATCRAEETLHPYFDDIEAEEWLFADIETTPIVGFSFRVSKPAGWSPILFSRVKGHFQKFGLGALYSSNAAVELSNIKGQFANLFRLGGEEAVRQQLLDGFESRRAANRNSFWTAMYRAMANDAWFHTNGFA